MSDPRILSETELLCAFSNMTSGDSLTRSIASNQIRYYIEALKEEIVSLHKVIEANCPTG
jgi:hypothetical protein